MSARNYLSPFLSRINIYTSGVPDSVICAAPDSNVTCHLLSSILPEMDRASSETKQGNVTLGYAN